MTVLLQQLPVVLISSCDMVCVVTRTSNAHCNLCNMQKLRCHQKYSFFKFLHSWLCPSPNWKSWLRQRTHANGRSNYRDARKRKTVIDTHVLYEERGSYTFGKGLGGLLPWTRLPWCTNYNYSMIAVPTSMWQCINHCCTESGLSLSDSGSVSLRVVNLDVERVAT